MSLHHLHADLDQEGDGDRSQQGEAECGHCFTLMCLAT